MSKTGLPKDAILIVNGGSRTGADVFDQAREKLVAAGLTLLDCKLVEKPEEIGDAVADAVKRAPMVILGGGDGSLSSNVEPFLGSDCVLGVLPLGTANSFARTLGIPLDVDGAVDVIANGRVETVDVGRIGKTHFLNAAAVGLAPEVAESVPHGLKRLLGRLGYLIWAGWSASSFNAFRAVIDDGRREHRFWATELRIGNGRFHGGVELMPDASPGTGELIVQAVPGRSLVRLGWSYVEAGLKLESRARSVREFSARRFKIKTRPPLRVSIDGELGPYTPFEATVLPQAVKVAAPVEA